jgi:hypothetical protein
MEEKKFTCLPLDVLVVDQFNRVMRNLNMALEALYDPALLVISGMLKEENGDTFLTLYCEDSNMRTKEQLIYVDWNKNMVEPTSDKYLCRDGRDALCLGIRRELENIINWVNSGEVAKSHPLGIDTLYFLLSRNYDSAVICGYGTERRPDGSGCKYKLYLTDNELDYELEPRYSPKSLLLKELSRREYAMLKDVKRLK